MIRILDIAKEDLRKHGMERQLLMVQRECAELIVAISDYRRGIRDADAMVRREMADVAFMIYELMVITETRSVDLAEMMVEKYEKSTGSM